MNLGCGFLLQRVHDALLQTSVGRALIDLNSIRLVLNARIPVLKFSTASWGIKFDVTANALTGDVSSSLVKMWVNRYHPVLEPTTLILKRWLVDRSFDEVYKGGLGGYSLINMIVAILQQNPDLQRSENALGRILYEFFHVFGSTFDYDRLMISVKGGRGICLRGGGPFAPPFRPRFPGYYYETQAVTVAIEDPADPSGMNNVSKGTFRMGEVCDFPFLLNEADVVCFA
ncbi:hypothetical protein BC829DRAFT_459 [Chytridium lagenaria]|nr:hypothetical protein BC829DRAFT_459 [Chytridium lagenaria]